MSLPDGKAVEGVHILPLSIRLWFGAEVVAKVFPVVAALIVGAKRAARVVSAMDHAIFAARVTSYPVDHAIFVPIDLLQHLLVGAVMAVGHQITRSLPAADVAGRNGPCSAGQFALTGEEFLVDRGAENGEAFAPLLNFGKFFASGF